MEHLNLKIEKSNHPTIPDNINFIETENYILVFGISYEQAFYLGKEYKARPITSNELIISDTPFLKTVQKVIAQIKINQGMLREMF